MKKKFTLMDSPAPHPLPRMGGAFLFGLFLWTVLTGIDPAGLVLGLPAAGVFSWFVSKNAGQGPRIRPTAIPSFFIYFLAQSFRTGMDVAWRALHPERGINPGFCTYPSRLPDGSPRALFANMVSILPGTLSWGLEGKIHKIHLLAGHPLILEDLSQLESRVARLYGIVLPETLV